MDRSAAVLIAAASGRALAASARRGGFVPLVADYFGDQDTVALAHAHVRLAGGLARGMDADVLEALGTLAASRHAEGAVCGTGFEDRPALIAQIARRWPLLGNDADTVTRVKDPLALAALCRDCGIPHPETSLVPPADPVGWLVKRRGGAGGQHVRPANGDHADGSIYVQRRVDGAPVSALALADGRRAMVLGLSVQWPSPTREKPFRYGGAVQPADVSSRVAAGLAAAVQRLTAAIPLVGLNSADFLVDGDRFWLLEINPRPSATLDLFEPREVSLFALHVAACRGQLPAHPPIHDGAAAAAIVYPESDMAVPAFDWPDWTTDRPMTGSAVRTDEPLCTVHARAPTTAAARSLAEQRSAEILASLSAGMS